ncbi:MAG: Na(+)/H(+) antiporter subunit D [Thermodesulfovibrio sp.]|nr:Na(+)/H(+) antiporter subunit D [Thermodesulfovibrio sp.]
MIGDWIHPGLLLILGSFLIPFFKGRLKQFYLVLIPTLALLICVNLNPGLYGVLNFLSLDITILRIDKLSLVFSYVFCIMGIIGMIYALHVKDDLQHIAAFIYIGSSLGVVFAGDLVVLYVFWELMAFSASALVFARRTKESIDSGYRYILVHVVSGLCLLGGIVIHATQTGSIAFTSMIPYEGNISFYLILISFLINAAVPPFGAWLPDAYPNATVTGAIFMTAYTTKSAVYVLIRGFPGAEILIWLGAIMAVYGVVYAVLENDSRRLLAYHIISQVGYMVCGVGIGTEMALNGATAHAFSHILYKGLLFMGAGAVLYMTGKSKLNELGGIYKTMPLTMVLYMIGGFSISGVPLFSGFVSKSVTVSAVAEAHMSIPYLMLLLASSGTFLHTGLKLPYYMFFWKDSGIRTQEPPSNMIVAMVIASLLCIFIGIFPNTLYAILPYPINYEPYTVHHIISTLGILAFTALGFFMLLSHLDPEPKISLDTDWFYRKGAKLGRKLLNVIIVPAEYKFISLLWKRIMDGIIMSFSLKIDKFENLKVSRIPEFFGNLSKLLSDGLAVFHTGKIQDYAIYMLSFLGLVLLIYFLF